MSSGSGGFLNAFWQPATDPIVVGEAGGFQDFLWALAHDAKYLSKKKALSERERFSSLQQLLSTKNTEFTKSRVKDS